MAIDRGRASGARPHGTLASGWTSLGVSRRPGWASGDDPRPVGGLAGHGHGVPGQLGVPGGVDRGDPLGDGGGGLGLDQGDAAAPEAGPAEAGPVHARRSRRGRDRGRSAGGCRTRRGGSSSRPRPSSGRRTRRGRRTSRPPRPGGPARPRRRSGRPGGPARPGAGPCGPRTRRAVTLPRTGGEPARPAASSRPRAASAHSSTRRL